MAVGFPSTELPAQLLTVKQGFYSGIEDLLNIVEGLDRKWTKLLTHRFRGGPFIQEADDPLELRSRHDRFLFTYGKT